MATKVIIYNKRTAENIKLDLNGDETIQQIKMQLCKEDPNAVRIIYNGRLLNDLISIKALGNNVRLLVDYVNKTQIENRECEDDECEDCGCKSCGCNDCDRDDCDGCENCGNCENYNCENCGCNRRLSCGTSNNNRDSGLNSADTCRTNPAKTASSECNEKNSKKTCGCSCGCNCISTSSSEKNTGTAEKSRPKKTKKGKENTGPIPFLDIETKEMKELEEELMDITREMALSDDESSIKELLDPEDDLTDESLLDTSMERIETLSRERLHNSSRERLHSISSERPHSSSRNERRVKQKKGQALMKMVLEVFVKYFNSMASLFTPVNVAMLMIILYSKSVALFLLIITIKMLNVMSKHILQTNMTDLEMRGFVIKPFMFLASFVLIDHTFYFKKNFSDKASDS